MKSAQEIFDMTVKHLRTQGCQSWAKDEMTCAYRGVNGAKCAAGIHIPDEDYKPEFENKFWEGTSSIGLKLCDSYRYELAKIVDRVGHEVLIRGFQSIHDDVDISNWEDAFKDHAERHGLVYRPSNDCLP